MVGLKSGLDDVERTFLPLPGLELRPPPPLTVQPLTKSLYYCAILTPPRKKAGYLGYVSPPENTKSYGENYSLLNYGIHRETYISFVIRYELHRK
jgi:hypothetical protein